MLVDEVECAATWLIKHAKRGRRVKQFVIALAQNDTVKNFGFEGDSGVMDCFRMIRLGSKAVKHAQRLKNDALVQWLRSDRAHCLVNDIPVKLPSYREMKAVTQRLGNSNQPVTGQLAQVDDAVNGRLGNGYMPVTVPPHSPAIFDSVVSAETPSYSRGYRFMTPVVVLGGC